MLTSALATALLFAVTATAPSDEAPGASAPALAQEGDRLEEDLDDVEVPPPPPPPPSFDDPADDEERAREDEPAPAPGGAVAPPPPDEPQGAPGADLGAPAPPGPPGPAAPPSAPSGPAAPVNRMLAAGLAAGLGAGAALPAAGCCFCCGWAGCLAPPIAGVTGTGAGALLGALLADVPMRDAWLPALAATGLGLAGGLLALPCGCMSFNVISILMGRSTDLPRPVPFNDSTLLLASAAGATTVFGVIASGAVGGAGIMYLLLPEEAPAAPVQASREPAHEPAPPPVARVIAY